MLPPLVELDSNDNENNNNDDSGTVIEAKEGVDVGVVKARVNNNNNNQENNNNGCAWWWGDKRPGDVGSNGLLETYLPDRGRLPPPTSPAPGSQQQQPAAASSSAGSLDRECPSGSSCGGDGSAAHDLDESECDGDAEDGDDEDDLDAPCDIGLVERLIRTHPVWFLPGIQRAGAFHLLQGKEEGNFVVRQSSQPDTMAISVRLPAGRGPYIEHYLVQAHGGKLGLESSDNRFDNIPSLVAHYSQCCDELPVQLTLPRALREARNRQQLSSLALLGQEFWRYPMANPRPPEQPAGQAVVPPAQNVTPLEQVSPSSASASSLSSFGSGSRLASSCGGTPTSEPCSCEVTRPVVLELAPLSPAPSLSTFKGCNENNAALVVASPGNVTTTGGKTPPPPPPRWAKPSVSLANNFTVTTTVTFSVNQASTPPAHVEVSCVQVTPKRPLSGAHSPPLLTPVPSPLSPSATSPLSDQQKGVSRPGAARKVHGGRSRQMSLKESQHYQECDILESPTVYYQSSLADKASDYEDIWGPASGGGGGDPPLSTFKAPPSSPFSSPEGGPPPDLVERLTPLQAPPPAPKPRAPPLVLPSVTQQQQAPAVNQSPQSPSTPAEEQPPPTPKQGSPFYAEPADAVRSPPLAAAFGLQRRPPANNRPPAPASHRHSDPAPGPRNSVAPQRQPPPGLLQRIDSSEELTLSADDVRRPRHVPRRRRVGRRPLVAPTSAWALDSSWEFIGNDDEAEDGHSDGGSNGEDGDGTQALVGDERERRFPSLEQQATTLDEDGTVPASTVHDLIMLRFPSLRLSPDPLSMATGGGGGGSGGTLPSTGSPLPVDGTCSRVSSYDNVENGHRSHSPDRDIEPRRSSSQQQDEDTLTEFSEPWDSSRWESLLAAPQEAPPSNDTPTPPNEPLLSPPRLQTLRGARALSEGSCAGSGGAAIRAYALHLAADRSTTFAQNVDNFIACTRESRETSPQVVMRNMRQFMSGMKNYLVKHGEREFEKEVEKERVKLRANEFLNLDAILEGVMQRLVVRPLREHLYRLFVEEYAGRRGEVRRLAAAVVWARSRSPRELGVRAGVRVPTASGLASVAVHIRRLQAHDLPLDKLDALLSAVAAIFSSVKTANAGRSVVLTADDFLPLLVWVLVQTGMVAAEIEAELMWGLLQPSLLSGEAGYYLTALSSAVHVLKSFRRSTPSATGCPQGGLAADVEMQSVLKVVVPDEVHGSIITKTLPVRPHMTTRDVCKIIAHKVRITNPQDYGLFKLVDGEETLLGDGECPQDVRCSVASAGKHCMFAYKRIDAKIAWPRTST